MTEDQVAWIDSRIRPMGSRASVIRELVEDARRRISQANAGLCANLTEPKGVTDYYTNEHPSKRS